jgi:hypothetical protein
LNLASPSGASEAAAQELVHVYRERGVVCGIRDFVQQRSCAYTELVWRPKVNFAALVNVMVEADIKMSVRKDALNNGSKRSWGIITGSCRRRRAGDHYILRVRANKDKPIRLS